MYVKIESWHEVLTPTRVPDRYRTRCGRNATGPTVDALPLDEKSCETCLRYSRADQDAAASVETGSEDAGG